jgi:hypothetical protein
LAALTRARARRAPIPARSDADRPAPAGWAGLLADVDSSFSRNCCWQNSGADDGARAIGADADVGFAWSGGGDGAGAGRAQRATRSSTTIAKFRSTDSGRSLRRALSPTFRAGELAFFIPWRVVAENPARRILLLDLPGPALRLLTDVADFRFSYASAPASRARA